MEGNEVEYEEDRLGVAWARTRDSGSVSSAFAITLNGKTTAVNANHRKKNGHNPDPTKAEAHKKRKVGQDQKKYTKIR